MAICDVEAERQPQKGTVDVSKKGCVAAVKWQDSKPVTVLSTLKNPKETTVVKRKNRDGSTSPVFCPKAIAGCNMIMGGVDRFDQRRERYATGRKSVKWWHRLFYFLIDMATVNA
jgi:hypothetical protein